MIKILTILLAILTVCSCGSAESSEAKQIAYVFCAPDSQVNIRMKPSKHGGYLGYREFGDEIYLDGIHEGNWLHCVDLGLECDEGWIYDGNVVYSEPEKCEGVVGKVMEKRLLVRNSVDGKIIRALNKGTRIKILGRCGEWVVTRIGYIRREYLEEEAEN